MACINNCFYCQHDCIYEALDADRLLYKRQKDKVLKRHHKKELQEAENESLRHRECNFGMC